MTQPSGRPRRASAPSRRSPTSPGVSRATVSRVVNGSPRVSPDVRVDVQAAIERLGYVPNRAARSLVTRRSDSIAVVITEPTGRLFSDPFFPRLLRGISSELAARDRQLVLLMPDSAADEHAHRRLPDRRPRRRRPAGQPPRRRPAARPARRRRHPDRPRRSPGQGHRRRATSTSTTARAASRPSPTSSPAAAGSSRRSPARRTWPPASTACAGYRDALTEAGLPADPTLEAIGDFTQDGGAAAMEPAARGPARHRCRLRRLGPDGRRRPVGPRRRRSARPRRRRGRRLRRLARRDVDAPPDSPVSANRSRRWATRWPACLSMPSRPRIPCPGA